MANNNNQSVVDHSGLPHFIKDIFEGAHECVSRLDTNNNFLSVNRNFADLSGYSAQAMIGKSWMDIIFKSDHHIARQAYDLMIESGRSEALVRCKHSSGSSYLAKIAFIRGLQSDPSVSSIYLFLDHITDPDNKKELARGSILEIGDQDFTNLALEKTYRALRVLSDCNDALLRIQDERDLLNSICNCIVKSGGYRYAWVGVPQCDEEKLIKPVAHAGVKDKEFFNHKIAWGDDKWGNGPAGTAVKTGQPYLVNNIFEDPKTKPWREKAVLFGFYSLITLPIQIENKTVAVLAIYAPNKEAFDSDETELLKRLTNNISFGIQSIRDQERKEKTEIQLELENLAFQLFSSDQSLEEFLDRLILKMESVIPESRGSVLLVDESGEYLQHCSAPSLSDPYNQAIDGIKVGPNSCSCGTAVYKNENILVENIEQDERWREYSALAVKEGLLSCHSVPIRYSNGKVLGTFAIYFTRVKAIEEDDIHLLERMAYIFGSAIENKRSATALNESQERFQLLSLATHDGVYDWDLTSNKVWKNEAYYKLYGSDQNKKPTEDWRSEKILPSQREQVLSRLKRKFENKFSLWMEEYSYRKTDGEYAVIIDRGYIIYDHDDKPIRMIGSFSDITDRKKAEKEIKESESRFRSLYDDSPTMLFTLTTEGEIVSTNRFGSEHLGYSVDDLAADSIIQLCAYDDRAALKEKLLDCITHPDEIHRCEVRLTHKFGDIRWVRATMRLIKTKDGDDQLLVTCEDISETRMLSEQLEYQAKHDPLTGLINRGEFERRLRRIIESPSEHDHERHALCYLDLDQFKVINDISGHLAGDELIRELSYLLSSVVRKRDTLARIGGDEFAILMEHCSIEQATRVANDLLKAVDNFKFNWQEIPYSVGVSIGVVPINVGEGTVQDILSIADAACFAAKDAGRNRLHVYKEYDLKFTQRQHEMQWVSKINQALEEDRLCLAYQAIQPIGEERFKGEKHYEVLVRMKDENGEIIPPGVFLPAAEKYNLSAKIDRWVVDTIFDYLLNNPNELENLEICAINLSGHTFDNKEFLTMLQDRFKQGDIPADKICFEITETAAIADLGNAIQFMQKLRAIGCKFALDDFGTGLSSFNYLKILPVDYLKIDGSFIRDICKNPIDQAMVRSINDVGKVVGKKIVAEFVENDEIIEVLKEIGVDYVQGYGIHQPELMQLKQ